MIREVVDLKFAQSAKKSSQPITRSLPTGDLADDAFRVDVNLGTGVTITKPGWRHARDDIVVVHPTLVIELNEAHVTFVANSRAAVSIDLTWLRLDMSKMTATCADRLGSLRCD